MKATNRENLAYGLRIRIAAMKRRGEAPDKIVILQQRHDAIMKELEGENK